jgi:hypothetical protein
MIYQGITAASIDNAPSSTTPVHVATAVAAPTIAVSNIAPTTTLAKDMKQAAARSRPAVKDGFIRLELSGDPVSYHLTWCFGDTMEDIDCNDLATRSCRMACLIADMIRGRPVSASLQRSVIDSCLKRLETVSYLLDNHMRTHEDLKAQLRYLPAVPLSMHGVFVSETKLDMAVHLRIGQSNYWVNLILRLAGSRWLCVYADMG